MIEGNLDIFYFAFSVKEASPNMKYWIYPGITWKI